MRMGTGTAYSHSSRTYGKGERSCSIAVSCWLVQKLLLKLLVNPLNNWMLKIDDEINNMHIATFGNFADGPIFSSIG